MELYLLRHAIAAERGTIPSDFDRPLTPEGEQKLRRATKAMRTLDLTFQLILTSPYVRARETAEIVATALAQRKTVQLWESLGAEANPREFIAELRAVDPAPASVLLVGHEPFLSTLAGILLGGAERSFLTLKKAGFCLLKVEALRIGRCARLEWLLTPRQMQLMA